MEQSGEGVGIIQGVIRFLSLFLPVTLAKRAAAMILIAAGAPDCRVTGLTGLCNRSVRALRKALREGDPVQLLSIKRGSGRKSRTVDVESQIFEELEKNNYHTRQQVADMIEEKFHSAANGRNQKRETHTLLMCYNAHRKSEANPKGAFQSKGVCLHVRYYGAVCR